MKNLLNLLFVLLSGTGCITAMVAETTEAFFLGGVIMCLSSIAFLINVRISGE